MNNWLKKNLSNIFIVIIFLALFLTGRFNIIFEKIRAMMGEDKGKVAYNFKVNDLKNNNEIQLSGLKGKVVLIDFWATWCPPCRYEIPNLVSLHNTYKNRGFEIIGLSFDKTGKSDVLEYMKKENIEYPVALVTKNISENYGEVNSLPTAFLIDKNGKIQHKYVGITLKSTIENDITTLINQ